jgi:hypothetical protein
MLEINNRFYIRSATVRDNRACSFCLSKDMPPLPPRPVACNGAVMNNEAMDLARKQTWSGKQALIPECLSGALQSLGTGQCRQSSPTPFKSSLALAPLDRAHPRTAFTRRWLAATLSSPSSQHFHIQPYCSHKEVDIPKAHARHFRWQRFALHHCLHHSIFHSKNQPSLLLRACTNPNGSEELPHVHVISTVDRARKDHPEMCF